MVSVSQTPWAPYTTTTWGTATTQTIASRDVWNDMFGELVWAVNGGLGGHNFQYLVNLFSTPGRTWAKQAVRESQIDWDPQDGHDHTGDYRHRFSDHKIMKKNLDPRSARVVWTALDGSVSGKFPTGPIVVGGVHTFTLTPQALEAGAAPGDLTANYLFGGTATSLAVHFDEARYGYSGNPFIYGVQPVVVANFLIPCVWSGGSATPVPPQIQTYGRWGIEMGTLSAAYDYCASGFYVWWSGFSMHASQTAATTFVVCVAVPWLAFGAGFTKVTSWA